MTATAFLGCGDDGPTGSSNEPAALELWLGDSQCGEVGQQLSSDLVVRVVDASGFPVSNVPVGFELVSGGGSISRTGGTTDKLGNASTALTLGPQPIINQVTVSSTGLSSVTFTARGLYPVTIDSLDKGVGWVHLYWTHEPSDGFESYEVYGGKSFDLFQENPPLITIENPEETQYTDVTVIDDGTYSYSVLARYSPDFAIQSPRADTTGGIILPLGVRGYDLVIDSVRNMAYAASSASSCILSVSLNDFEIVDRLDFDVSVRTIDLSPDCSKLFVTAGTMVRVYHPDGWTLIKEIDISEAANTSAPYDIEVVDEQRVCVSSLASASSPAYAVMIEPDDDYKVSRIGSNQALTASYRLCSDSVGDAVFGMTQSGWDLRTVCKIDLRTDSYPLVFNENHTISYLYFNQFTVSHDGSQIYAPDGNIYNGNTGLFLNNLAVRGQPELSGDGKRIYLAKSRELWNGYQEIPGVISVIDGETHVLIGSIPFNYSPVSVVRVAPGDSALFIITDTLLYGLDIRRFDAQ